MKNSEYRTLQQFSTLSRLHASFAKRSSQSKRIIKGKSKHVNIPLKYSRVASISHPNKLFWSPFNYKALNSDFNKNNAS